jgi:hypothetical protein
VSICRSKHKRQRCLHERLYVAPLLCAEGECRGMCSPYRARFSLKIRKRKKTKKKHFVPKESAEACVRVTELGSLPPPPPFSPLVLGRVRVRVCVWGHLLAQHTHTSVYAHTLYKYHIYVSGAGIHARTQNEDTHTHIHTHTHTHTLRCRHQCANSE